MEQSGSLLETMALVAIALGCFCTVLGTVGIALKVKGSEGLAGLGVGERGPQ